MTMELELLLDDIVAFINQLREDDQSPNVIKIGENIVYRYAKLKKENVDIFHFFDTTFSKDVELYILIMSVFIFISEKQEFLDKVESIIQDDMIAYELILGIRKQIEAIRFRSPETQGKYKCMRMCHAYMVQRLKRELDISVKRIPYEERNHKRVLLSTDTLLADGHAPTKIVLDIAESLQKKGYEVRILVGIEKVNEELVEKYWMYPYQYQYLSEYDGEFERVWNNEVLKGYQQVIDVKHYGEARELLKKIEVWKPECIWHIGGHSIFADILGEISTLVVMTCTSGEILSDAPVFVRYFQKTSLIVEEMKKYVSEMKQKLIEIKIGFSFKLAERPYTRQEFGIPENAFVIAIVGNRLDTEMNTQFIEMMEQMIEMETQICFVLIGETIRNWNQGRLNGHIHCLGYQKSLVDILKLTDLFLNPPRQGGAGGAACAIAAGVPVLSLPDCDVADGVGEMFCCKRLEDMPGQVMKYLKNDAYYKERVKICKEMQEERVALDRNKGEEYTKVICQITDWLQKGEIE